MPHSAAPAGLVGVAVEPVPGQAAEHERRRAGELRGATRRRARRCAPRSRRRRARSIRQCAPMPSASARLPRRWCRSRPSATGASGAGAGARQAASTSRSSTLARDRLVGEGADRAARLDERRNLMGTVVTVASVAHRNRSSCGSAHESRGTSAVAEPRRGRGRGRSRPGPRRPCPSRARPRSRSRRRSRPR